MNEFKTPKNKAHTENNNKGMTLIELLIAVCIFGLIIAGISSIDTFCRYHVVSSDKRVKLQNDVSFILEHMAKEIGKAIGDANNLPVVIEDSNRRVKIYVDLASDGSSTGDGRMDTEGDRWIAYQYSDSPNYEIRYYYDYNGHPNDYEVLSKKISSFSPAYTSGSDYVGIQLFACWDPSVAGGTLDNPSLEMKNRIYMPSVSTN